MNKKYEQLKVAVQDLCIELGISSTDIRSIAAGLTYPDKYIESKVTVKTAQKLLDAGLLE